MNLDQYIDDRSRTLDGFRRWMNGRVLKDVEAGSETWDKLFVVWESMIDGGAADPEISMALKAMLRGWNKI